MSVIYRENIGEKTGKNYNPNFCGVSLDRSSNFVAWQRASAKVRDVRIGISRSFPVISRVYVERLNLTTSSSPTSSIVISTSVEFRLSTRQKKLVESLADLPHTPDPAIIFSRVSFNYLRHRRAKSKAAEKNGRTRREQRCSIVCSRARVSLRRRHRGGECRSRV